MQHQGSFQGPTPQSYSDHPYANPSTEVCTSRQTYFSAIHSTLHWMVSLMGSNPVPEPWHLIQAIGSDRDSLLDQPLVRLFWALFLTRPSTLALLLLWAYIDSPVLAILSNQFKENPHPGYQIRFLIPHFHVWCISPRPAFTKILLQPLLAINPHLFLLHGVEPDLSPILWYSWRL